MDTKYRLHIAPKDAAAGAVPDVDGRRPVTLVCITLIVLGLAATLVATLPQTLDAAASPAPAASSPSATAPAERTFHEQHPVQSTTSSVDALEESELATWRLRASD